MPDNTHEIKLVRLQTLEEIRAYRQVWLSLCEHRDADPDFFEFFLSSRPSASAYLLLLETQATQVLIVCRLEREKLDSKIGYFSVGSPRLRILEVIHGGILGQIDTRSARVIATHLDGLLRCADVDLITLHHTDVRHPLYTELARMHPLRFNRFRVRKATHWFRQVDAVRCTFAESVSRNERSNQRRRERKLLEEYREDVRIECYESTTSVPRLLIDAERIASKSYQRGLNVGFAPTQDIRRRIEFLANHGWLSAWVLYLADNPVAFWIGTLREGVFFSDYLAYDTGYSRMAPGTYLTIKVLEKMHDAKPGVRVIDFGPGDAAYKARFGTEERTVATVNMFALTLPGLCANVLADLTVIAHLAGKTALEKCGALGLLKRTLRRGIADRSSLS